jgi:hypothetical protein
MRLYKTTGGYYNGSTFYPKELTINIDNIDCFCSVGDVPGYDRFYMHGQSMYLIKHEDREKIEKILNCKELTIE